MKTFKEKLQAKKVELAAKLGIASLAGVVSTGAQAHGGGTGGSLSSDEFYSFYSTVLGWTGGALGTGLALSMLLIGGGMGVAKNSPMPALSGVGGAAFLHWGPQIINSMMGAAF